MLVVNRVRVEAGDLWETPIGRVVVRGFYGGRVVLRQTGGIIRIVSPKEAVFLLRQGELMERKHEPATVAARLGAAGVEVIEDAGEAFQDALDDVRRQRDLFR